MPRHPRTRRDIDPATVYQQLGPITPAEATHLARLGHDERDRWFGNIYGRATSPYARHQYQLIRRTQTR